MTTKPSHWCDTGRQPCPTPHLCNEGRCFFNEASYDSSSGKGEMPIKMLPDPPEWVNDHPEFRWSLVAWALLLVAGAFGIVGLVL